MIFRNICSYLIFVNIHLIILSFVFIIFLFLFNQYSRNIAAQKLQENIIKALFTGLEYKAEYSSPQELHRAGESIYSQPIIRISAPPFPHQQPP